MGMSDYVLEKEAEAFEAIDAGARAEEREAIRLEMKGAHRAIRELLELIDLSEMDSRDMPAHEYEATKGGAICGALRVLRGRP